MYTGDLYSFLYQNVENKEDWYLNAKKLYIKGEELGNEGCIIGKLHLNVDWSNVDLFNNDEE